MIDSEEDFEIIEVDAGIAEVGVSNFFDLTEIGVIESGADWSFHEDASGVEALIKILGLVSRDKQYSHQAAWGVVAVERFEVLAILNINFEVEISGDHKSTSIGSRLRSELG